MTNQLHALLSQTGEHTVMFQGLEGQLEGRFSVPNTPIKHHMAILGHPHSLHGGTMQNKVVTTLVKTFLDAHIPVLRFNFRGVGLSEGVYDNGIGESADMVHIIETITASLSIKQWYLAGFSFGSFVTYQAALSVLPSLLISIAPAVHHYDYEQGAIPGTWVVVQGDKDEVVCADEVYRWMKMYPSIHCIRFEEATHFFHGHLTQLKEALLPSILKASST